MKRFLTLVALLYAPVVYGQLQVDVAEYERVLLPIMAKPTSGALGSLFVTNLRVLNQGPGDLDAFPLFIGPECPLPTCSLPTVPPGYVYEPRVEGISEPGTPPGIIVYVRPADGAKMTFNLRIQDVSRQALTWGTEIPVVRQSDLFTDALHLLDVPLDDRFRHAIRLYDIDARTEAKILVRVYKRSTNIAQEFVGEATLDFSTAGVTHAAPGFNRKPGYVQISSLYALFPGLKGAEFARVDVIPLTPGLRYWGFASITNNETQHITIISPQ